MNSFDSNQLIAIIGPTGSGKTSASLQIAQHLNGEVICADSRTIYREMDIGTAKPTAYEQSSIKHHLLDVIYPDQGFTVADFKKLAQAAIKSIQDSSKLPILVGGSGLYIDSVCYDFDFRKSLHSILSDKPLQELQLMAHKNQIDLNASDFANKRRLVRALQSGYTPRGSRKPLPHNWHIIGIDPGLHVIEHSLAARTKNWLTAGLAQEADSLFRRYGEVEALNTTPYKELRMLTNGDLDQTACEDLINLHLRQLAKRQLTWFRRNPDITWVKTPAEALAAAKRLLARGF